MLKYHRVPSKNQLEIGGVTHDLYKEHNGFIPSRCGTSWYTPSRSRLNNWSVKSELTGGPTSRMSLALIPYWLWELNEEEERMNEIFIDLIEWKNVFQSMIEIPLPLPYRDSADGGFPREPLGLPGYPIKVRVNCADKFTATIRVYRQYRTYRKGIQ